MKKFSIGELEQLSGIKAHTIRIWESRYGFPVAGRNIHNLRYYSPAEARRFFQAALLYRGGWRISKVLLLDDNQRYQRLQASAFPEDQLDLILFELIVLMWQEDIEAFEAQLDSLVAQFGLHAALDEVIAPFLEKTGLLSYRHGGVRVHFVVTALRRKIISAIESIPTPQPTQRALLFLPKGEHYDLVLLYTFFRLRRKGMGVLYLGTNIDEHNLAEVLLSKKIDVMYGYLPDTYKQVPEEYLHRVTTLCAPVPLILLVPETQALSWKAPGVDFRHFRGDIG